MLTLPERYRTSVSGIPFQQGNKYEGVFKIPHDKIADYHFFVIASSGSGWEHVSVSLISKKKNRSVDRCPTWFEMCFIKEMFFSPETPVVQYHPRKEDNVSNHEFCLHLWHPLYQELPLPDPRMVGVPGLENQQDTMNPAEALKIYKEGNNIP